MKPHECAFMVMILHTFNIAMPPFAKYGWFKKFRYITLILTKQSDNVKFKIKVYENDIANKDAVDHTIKITSYCICKYRSLSSCCQMCTFLAIIFSMYSSISVHHIKATMHQKLIMRTQGKRRKIYHFYWSRISVVFV